MKKRTTKAQWLEKALELLEESGAEALTVHRLAKTVGSSRTSFYWHFKDRNDLIQQLLHYWSNEFTGIVTDDHALQDLDGESRLNETVRLIREHGLTRYDLSIHTLARTDPHAKELLIEVIDKRRTYVRGIFKDLGFQGKELEMRTHLFVCYYSCESLMFDSFAKDHVRTLTNSQIDFLKRP